MNLDSITRFFDAVPNYTVLVIGDVILDAYYRGAVNRISPEAPVSILDVRSKEFRLGGAANVALNIKGMKAKPILCSVIGGDESGEKLLSLMREQGVSTDGMVSSDRRVTSLKTRLMSGHHQLIRMDEEQCDLLHESDRSALYERVQRMMEEFAPNAIIFEDYDKGVLSAELIRDIMALAESRGIPTTVDPKRRNFLNYSGATLFKPNMRELSEGLHMPDIQPTAASLVSAFRTLQETMPVAMAFFTLSADGVFITDGTSQHHIPAQIRNIADVSGAGDTVISVATCALAAGLGMEEIAFISNLSGGWVCQFPGVVAIEADALKQEYLKIVAAS